MSIYGTKTAEEMGKKQKEHRKKVQARNQKLVAAHKRFQKEIRNRIIIYTYGKRFMAWILPWIFHYILLVVLSLIDK